MDTLGVFQFESDEDQSYNTETEREKFCLQEKISLENLQTISREIGQNRIGQFMRYRP